MHCFLTLQLCVGGGCTINLQFICHVKTCCVPGWPRKLLYNTIDLKAVVIVEVACILFHRYISTTRRYSMGINVFTCIFNNTNKILYNHSLLKRGSFARSLLVAPFKPFFI